MNYADLIQAIQAQIRDNTTQAITGQILQDILVDMVQEMGQAGAVFGGVVDRDFTPAATDSNIFYIAAVPGTYSGFEQSVSVGEFAIFYYDGTDWQKATVTSAEVEVTPGSENGITLATINVGGQNYLIKAEVKDTNPAEGSAHPITSGGVYDALQTIATQISAKADTTYVDNQLATKADANATTTALAGKVDKVPAAEAGNVAMFDATGGIEDSEVPADNIAQQDGYYSPMIVGAAENLVGQDVQTAQFTRRVSGGSADVGTGAALIKSIKGNTLVWNQQAPDTYDVDFIGYSGTTTMAFSGHTATWIPISGSTVIAYLKSGGNNYFNFPFNHKIFIKRSIKSTTNCKGGINDGNNWHFTTYTADGNWHSYSEIITFTSLSSQGHRICQVDNGTPINGDIYIKDILLIDLTQMFGSGNEPSTAAEFEALFPLNYYAYNTGSLLNLTATGLQTNGFNQWDEEWQNGFYNTSGGYQSNQLEICTKNFIPVFPGAVYYNSKYNNSGRILYYDADKNYTGYVNYYGQTFTIPSGCYYIKLNFGSTYGPTYNHNICINKSDTDKNGTYEPYWSETKALPITTATSGGVAIFSDGIKSAGTAHDRYYKSAGSDLFDKAEKQIVEIDLGDLNWLHATGDSPSYDFFYCGYAGGSTSGNIRCAIYTTGTVGASAGSDIAINYLGNIHQIRVRNLVYGTNAASFKTAMAGVKAYIELASYVDYTLDTPFNGQYRVDNDGTETILPENGSTPTTAPFLADIQYAMNAVDTLRNLPKNYISKASMDSILTAFKTAGVITAYTLTWDSTNNKYNCTITV